MPAQWEYQVGPCTGIESKLIEAPLKLRYSPQIARFPLTTKSHQWATSFGFHDFSCTASLRNSAQRFHYILSQSKVIGMGPWVFPSHFLLLNANIFTGSALQLLHESYARGGWYEGHRRGSEEARAPPCRVYC